MKRNFILFFLCLSVLCFAEKYKYEEGYANVKWGASIKEVQTAFPGGSIIEADELKVSEYYQQNPEKLISQRIFCFFEDKLFEVQIIFDEKAFSDDTVNLIMQKLVVDYGKNYKNEKEVKYKDIAGYTIKAYIEFNIWILEKLTVKFKYVYIDGYELTGKNYYLFYSNNAITQAKEKYRIDKENDDLKF